MNRPGRPSIIMAVTNDLVTDQRVHRSCCALQEAGYEVTLVGRRLKHSEAVSRTYRTERMRLLFERHVWFYAEYNLRLFLKLMGKRADAFYANDTDTLPACYYAARLRRKPLFYDAHEMFPEVPELVGRARVKRFWQRLERRLMPRVDGACTVCQSVADAYRELYGVEMAVVRNVPQQEVKAALPQHNAEGPRVLLYQGAVNVGRGVDWMIEAMEYLPGCRLVVAGVGDEYERLRDHAASVAWHDRIRFEGRLEPERLQQLTQQADLGLVLLENRGLNYYYSLPNRVGDMVRAGVPLLATDFPEIRRAVAPYGVGTLVPEGVKEPQQLARYVTEALELWDALPAEERRQRMEAAREELDWKRDKNVLLSAVNAIFAEDRR